MNRLVPAQGDALAAMRAADLNHDGVVNGSDLLITLNGDRAAVIVVLNSYGSRLVRHTDGGDWIVPDAVSVPSPWGGDWERWCVTDATGRAVQCVDTPPVTPAAIGFRPASIVGAAAIALAAASAAARRKSRR